MGSESTALRIAIDGGTTNTRAWLFRGQEPIGQAQRPVGVREVAAAGSKEPLRRAVADCIGELVNRYVSAAKSLECICASGMLTSNVGLHEVPHVAAPAGLDDLAAHVRTARYPALHPEPLQFVPGVRCGHVAADAGHELDALNRLDMLRGEESETMGIMLKLNRHGPLMLLLPGSHTKLLHVDDQDRIAASYTTLAGELIQALAQRSVLADSVHWPPSGEPDWPALSRGCRLAREHGLLRGGFAVRLADVLVGKDRAVCTWLLLGLVIGSDLADLSRWPAWSAELPVLVGGRQPLRTAYAHLLSQELRCPAEPLPESVVETAAPRGALAIVQRAGQRRFGTGYSTPDPP